MDKLSPAQRQVLQFHSEKPWPRFSRAINAGRIQQQLLDSGFVEIGLDGRYRATDAGREILAAPACAEIGGGVRDG